MPSSTYAQLADLEVRIEAHRLESLELDVAGDWRRVSTVVRLRGGGHEGVGEDVVYESDQQLEFQERGPSLPLAGSHTLASFSARLEDLELFPEPPEWKPSQSYRRWALESAALDLALRQSGTSLAEALGREPRPVRFVVSLGLGEPPSLQPVRTRLARYPELRFKVDPGGGWNDDLAAELAAIARVDVVDLKGYYELDRDARVDAALYRTIAARFPDAWLEDPRLDDACSAALEPHRDRVTWDAPLHSVADIEALPWPPRTINVKPSRFGTVRRLFDAYDHCLARGIGMYGGGQFELGPGRGQLQYLASLFHPDAPNDVAPVGYHVSPLPSGLPSSPLPPTPARSGFRWTSAVRPGIDRDPHRTGDGTCPT